MSRLDDELKVALQRKEAPPDFTARVLARVAELPPPPVSRWQRFLALFRLPQVRFAVVAVAACLVISLTFGVQQYRKYQEMRREAEIAKAQVMLAFQIASAKLNVAKQKVSRVAEKSAVSEAMPPEDRVEPQAAAKSQRKKR
ncbi:MAG TPA: hypothetical protein VFD58_25865 [Blastocatellia bacterium]|nr:hypothetical protein [Blastocatellia bacterium]